MRRRIKKALSLSVGAALTCLSMVASPPSAVASTTGTWAANGTNRLVVDEARRSLTLMFADQSFKPITISKEACDVADNGRAGHFVWNSGLTRIDDNTLRDPSVAPLDLSADKAVLAWLRTQKGQLAEAITIGCGESIGGKRSVNFTIFVNDGAGIFAEGKGNGCRLVSLECADVAGDGKGRGDGVDGDVPAG